LGRSHPGITNDQSPEFLFMEGMVLKIWGGFGFTEYFGLKCYAYTCTFLNMFILLVKVQPVR
jgi:hypothetical protein